MAITLLSSFEVRDFDAWKLVFDADASHRQQAGIITKSEFRSVGNQNIVAIISEVPSVTAVRAFYDLHAEKVKLQASGVISEVQMRVLTAV
jgi:hypothetical protein